MGEQAKMAEHAKTSIAPHTLFMDCSYKPLPIRTTKSTMALCGGLASSIPKNSMRARQRRRCGEGCRIGGSTTEQRPLRHYHSDDNEVNDH